MTASTLTPSSNATGKVASDAMPAPVRYAHWALGLALVLGAAVWFAVSISGDVHYELEAMHHHLETALIAVLGLELSFLFWEGLRRAGKRAESKPGSGRAGS